MIRDSKRQLDLGHVPLDSVRLEHLDRVLHLDVGLAPKDPDGVVDEVSGGAAATSNQIRLRFPFRIFRI